jgi:transposase-like protein
VHVTRNLLAHVPKAQSDYVAAAFRTIFAQATPTEVDAAWEKTRDEFAARFPKLGPLMDEAKAEVLAFTAFPRAHWRKIWSTNPLERVNKEIKRRTNVVGIFPNEAGVLRLAGSVLLEVHDEWQVTDRRYLSEGSMAKLYEIDNDDGHTKEVGPRHNELLAG